METIDLEYYTFDFRNISVNAIPEDDPTRLVQPVWRFAGTLETGEEFEEFLAPAIDIESFETAW